MGDENIGIEVCIVISRYERINIETQVSSQVNATVSIFWDAT
jgi:hypothetical protein